MSFTNDNQGENMSEDKEERLDEAQEMFPDFTARELRIAMTAVRKMIDSGILEVLPKPPAPPQQEVIFPHKTGDTYWLISHCPDTNETGILSKRTYVQAVWVGFPLQEATELLLEQFCIKSFKDKAAYIQGIAAVPNFEMKQISREEFEVAHPLVWGGWFTQTDQICLHLGTTKCSSGVDPIVVTKVKKHPARKEDR